MLSTKKTIKILAINPGTRYLGIAVFENQELVHWGCKTVKCPNVDELMLKTRNIITELFSTHQPDLVVLEKIFYVQCRNSEKLKKLCNEIKRLVKRRQLNCHEYTPITVRKQICQNDRATKKETFEIIVSLYPELAASLTEDQLYKDKYWGHVLDAVALGLCCWQNLK